MAKAGIKGIDQFEKDLLAYADISDDFVARAGKTVTPEVTRAARAGIGPNGERFAPYSDAYKKRKNSASGPQSEFMWGVAKKGSQHMMSPTNFKWEKISKLKVQLVWTASGKQGDYATVHQEGLGNMPRRTWMHLMAPRTQKIIDQLIKNILNDHARKFNAKYGKR